MYEHHRRDSRLFRTLKRVTPLFAPGLRVTDRLILAPQGT
jgi:hypothetical protein